MPCRHFNRKSGASGLGYFLRGAKIGDSGRKKG